MWEERDMSVPMADSCWCLTENKKFYKAVILQQKNNKVAKKKTKKILNFNQSLRRPVILLVLRDILMLFIRDIS